MGVFVVWLRMAYFGDTLAHSALLGISLGLLLEIDLQLSALLVALFVAAALLALQRRSSLATDTLLGILAHGSLAIGLLAISLRDDVHIDLMAYLFGDILAVGSRELLWIWLGAALGPTALRAIWRPLLNLTVHAELAKVDGVRVAHIKLAFMLLFALVIAVAMKLVGVLLITALLIIPAATAQRLSRSPEQMANAGDAIRGRRSLCWTGHLILAGHAGWAFDSGRGGRIVLTRPATPPGLNSGRYSGLVQERPAIFE